MMHTFDIISKMNIVVVILLIVLLYGKFLAMRTKVGRIEQSNNAISELRRNDLNTDDAKY